MTETVPLSTSCYKCNYLIDQETRFCPNCGNSQLQESKRTWVKFLSPILIFYFLIILFFIVGVMLDLDDDLYRIVIFDIVFSVMTIVFCFLNFKSLYTLLNFKKVRFLGLLSVIAGSVLFAILVYYFAEYLNQSLLETEHRHVSIFKNTTYPLLYMILSIAVQPAIFEELAFRGFILKNLEETTSPLAALIVSSIMFGVIHLSIISLIWIIPIGAFYAFMRQKTGVLWYGIFAHFFHNATIVVLELYSDNYFINWLGL